MIYFIISYILTSIAMIFVCRYKNTLTKPITNMRLNKYGLTFVSHARHKIKVGDAKIMQVDSTIYIKREKTIVLKNVDRVVLTGDWLYFTGLGEVKIIFNCKKFYRYFNVKITSSKFDLEPIKQQAMQQILDNLFNLNACDKVKRYIFILTEVLKITLSATRVEVKQNDFYIPFTLTYKANHKLKHLQVN